MTDTVSTSDVTTLGDVIYQGEGKWFKFTFTIDDLPVDLTDATSSFVIKQNLSDALPLYTATNIDYSSKGTGVIRVNLPSTTTKTMTPGTYYGELTTVLETDTDVDKKLVKFKIKQAVVTT